MQLPHRAVAVVSRAFALGLSGLLLAGPVRASVVVPLSLAQLPDAADLIVEARVLDVRHVEGPSGPERVVRLRVEHTWKGDTHDTVYVRVPGGRIGRLETRVTDTPSVDVGHRFVWFLTPNARGGHVIVGLHQGAMRTVDGPTGALVMAPAPSSTTRGDARRGWRRLDVLARAVRERVEATR